MKIPSLDVVFSPDFYF